LSDDVVGVGAGASAGEMPRSFIGFLDEVAVWSKALRRERIRSGE